MTNTTSNYSSVIKTRRKYLACSVLAMLFLGLIYAFSLFVGPMSESFGYSRSDLALTFNIMMIVFCIGCVAGSQIEARAGHDVSIAVSACCFCGAFVGTALFGGRSIWAVYLLYGCLGGFGTGTGNIVIASVTNLWFPEKVGFSSGIMMMAFGFSSLIFGSLFSALIPIWGLSTVFICIGTVTGVIVFAVSRILKRPPDAISLIISHLSEASQAAAATPPLSAAAALASPAPYDPADEDSIFTSPIFYLYYIWAIAIAAIGLATIGNCATDAQLAGFGTDAATLLVGFVSVSNGVSRIILGTIFDKRGPLAAMACSSATALAATVCIACSFARGSSLLYVIGALCCGFCYGAIPVLGSAFSRRRFGARRYTFNFAIVNMAIIFGSLLNILIQATAGSGDSRLGTFVVLLAVAAISLADLIPFGRVWKRDLSRLAKKAQMHEE